MVPVCTPIVLPARFKAMITRPTYFFYYSPTCGHCQTAIPEVVQLQERLKERLDFVAVASSMSSAQQITAFNDVYGVTFPTVHDHDGAFAQAIAARSTPTALVVAPAEEGGEVAKRRLHLGLPQGRVPRRHVLRDLPH